MQNIRDDIDYIIDQASFETDESMSAKRPRIIDDYKKRDALEVCDAILSEIKLRFQFTGHLIATNLFDVNQFDKYIANFADKYLEITDTYSFLES